MNQDNGSSFPSQPVTDQAHQMAWQMAEICQARLPLSVGLRAAAAEAPDRGLRRHLNALAAHCEQGGSLEQGLQDAPLRFPGYLATLVTAASHSEQVGGALTRVLFAQQRLDELWRGLRRAIAYPLLVLSLAFGMFAFWTLYVVPVVINTLTEFQLNLPYATRVLQWWSQQGIWIFLAAMAVLVVTGIALRLLLGAVRWRRLLWTMPLFGSLWQWSATAQWARWLSLLLAQEIPLPEALRRASEAVRDAEARRVSVRLAAEVEQGRALSECILAGRYLPASVAPLLRWGEQHAQLPAALDSIGEMMEERVQLRALFLRSALPAVVFLLVLSGLVFIVSSTMTPIVSLINGLSM